MARLTRRQFLGATAATGAAPYAWIRPVWAQRTEIRLLAGHHLVPAYDAWLDQWAEEWSLESGVKVTIDRVPHLQIPAKLRAEAATRSGHDIVQLVGSGTERWASALLDVQDVAERLARRHGGWTPLAEHCSKTSDGRFHSIPDFFTDLPGLYRKDLWTEVGLPDGPATWEDVHRGGMKLKTRGFPVGIGLGHHQDANASWRAIMWSYGASEVAPDGKTVTYNSREMREALKLNKALYQDAMTPEVLAWDDSSNDRFLASGRGSWVHNSISAYRAIEQQNGELAANVWVQLSPRGPVARRSFATCRSYGVTKFSANQDAAKAFLEALVDSHQDGARAAAGYNLPFLENFARPPLPVVSQNPKLKPLEQGPDYHFTTGYPGPFTWPAGEVFQQFVLVDALAMFCTGRLDLESTIRWAERRIRAVYADFAGSAGSPPGAGIRS